MKKTICVLFVCLYLTGCALSPQVVTIDPALSNPNDIVVATGTRFALLVSDTRKSEILGTRGGVYNDTAIVKTEGDITQKIRTHLTRLFETAGYIIDSSATTRMNIAIVDLTYQGYGENRISEVEVSAKISVTVSSPAGKISKNFNASHRQEVLKAPNENKNEEIINDIMSTVIQPLLDDKVLLDYIKQHQ
jgi:uncharacterized lipoprotein